MNSSGINVITFGCRLNACESDLIKNFADELGLSEFTLINTCTVTAEAERKLRQTIRRLYNENPNIRIILTGCASELNPDFYMKMDGVVGIISNKTKLSKAEYLKYSTNQLDNADLQCDSVPMIHKKVRGFLQIQNGCDQKCTYCVVRLTRGKNISFHEDEIVNQAKLLLKGGYKEIVLTGINISSYGRDLVPKRNLAFIVRHILKNLPELSRLRLSSLDPADIDADLIETIKSEEKLLPHLHESIQSGDNMILRRMMRRHTCEQVIEINEKILSARSEIIFGADVIVGFPTETDEMFLNTKSFLKKASLTLLHIFPFSPRPGTTAAMMPSVGKKIILNRANELKKLAGEILTKKLMEQIGKNVIALAEDSISAKTNSFLKIKSSKNLIAGKEYLFLCNSIDKDCIIAQPIEGK